MFKKFLLSFVCLAVLGFGQIGLAQSPSVGAVDSESVTSVGAQLDSSRLIAANPKIESKVTDFFKTVERESGLELRSDARFDADRKTPGLSNIVNIINLIIGLLKYIASGLMILFVTIAIVQMISSGDSISETWDKNKTYFANLLIAVGIILLVDVLFNDVFTLGPDNFLKSTASAKAAAGRLASQLTGITNILEMVAGAMSVFMFVLAGVNLTANAVDENAGDKAKKQIQYGIAGLLVIMLAETVVKDVLFVNQNSLDSGAAKQLLVGLTNFASGVVTTISLLAFFYAGYLYVFKGIEDSGDKIKSSIKGAITGILLSAAAFAIVNTLVTLDRPELVGSIINLITLS